MSKINNPDCVRAPLYDFGTKVHISSKLSEEELLFGESFGAAIVLLDEAKLMEIQRICIANGVSCSTIGRLQEKKELLKGNSQTAHRKIGI